MHTTKPYRQPLFKTIEYGGLTVNLHSLARAYRIAAVGTLSYFAVLSISFYLAGQGLTGLAGIALLIAQPAIGVTLGLAARLRLRGNAQVAPAPGRLTFGQKLSCVLVGIIGCVPVFGLLPAAVLCGNAHRVFNAVDVPVGFIGPSQAAIDALLLDACHACGYDISRQPGGTCPECGADISCDRNLPANNARPVELDRARVATAEILVGRTAFVGLCLGTVQALIYMSISSITARQFFWLWLPGPLWGIVAFLIARDALRLLKARGSVMHFAVLLLGCIWPGLGGLSLGSIAVRLGDAAKAGPKA